MIIIKTVSFYHFFDYILTYLIYIYIKIYVKQDPKY